MWVYLAGRGTGKTRTAVEFMYERIDTIGRWVLAGRTGAEVRDILIEGESGLLNAGPPHLRPIYNPSRRRVEFPNGAVALLRSGEEPDAFRGLNVEGFWFDEYCLVGETMVETTTGARRLDALAVGDYVATRTGPRRIVAAGLTRRAAPLWRLRLRDGTAVTGTANHPVYVLGRGFLSLACVQPGDRVSTWRESSETVSSAASSSWRRRVTSSAAGVSIARTLAGLRRRLGRVRCSLTRRSSGAASGGTSISTTATTGIEQGGSCTGRCIARRSGLSGVACTCITLTAIRLITSWLTSPYSRHQSTYGSTVLGDGRGEVRQSARRRVRGSGLVSQLMRLSARGVARLFNRRGRGRDSVQRLIGRRSMQVVEVSALGTIGPVYNIEVEGAHEYFANGILTHNCHWKKPQEAWDNFIFSFRSGSHPVGIVTTTPKPIPQLKKWVAEAKSDGVQSVVVTRGRTTDNMGNLAPAFIRNVVKPYLGTRLGRQELDAEILEDTPGALWTATLIEKHRVRREDLPPMLRLVVAVDPEAASDEDSAETGIIAGGLGANGHAYVMFDWTIRGTPAVWGGQAVKLYLHIRGDRIVGEVNNGGEMVEHVIRTVKVEGEEIGKSVPYKAVHASRGKQTRAEPVSSLYEQEMVHHVGVFPELEGQMCGWVPGMDSPDRMDALVWLITELLVGEKFSGWTAAMHADAERRGVRLVPVGEAAAVDPGDDTVLIT